MNLVSRSNLWLANVATLALLMLADGRATETTKPAAPIPWNEIRTKAEAQYKGDGLSLSATETGAKLRCALQKIEGEVSAEGLRLVSSERNRDDRFHVRASAVGRVDDPSSLTLTRTGTVELDDGVARFIRPGLVEEYSVSMDGVRQDLVVTERPAGSGQLLVELEVAGARAEAAPYGTRLLLECSGREIAYSRLSVADASGRALCAHIEATSAAALIVVVEDADAEYPVRIDPTFSDADWLSMGAAPGVDNTVRAVAVDGSGNVYIGGDFTSVQGLACNRIAKWNGSAWSALGTGLNGSATALAVSGTDLYVGGYFTIAGGVSANYVAKWNGSAWSALGTGLNYAVLTLAVSGTDLYAGGWFTTAGGVSANYIARWKENEWTALGTGLSNAAYALAVSGSDLYVGGTFATAGGVAANFIAKWNGSAWSALSTGMNNPVQALAVLGADLYAGGWFTTAGGVGANHIATWDGSAWSALGTGTNAAVYALAVSVADLYVGGLFTSAGGASASYIAKWKGGAWSTAGTGLNNTVHALAVSGPDHFVGGSFSTAGGASAIRIARWNSSGTWSALGSQLGTGLNDAVHALALSGNDVYAGGDFIMAGGVSANRVARWNGSAWSALGSGLNGTVNALAFSGTDLYVGGAFTMAGGVSANRIARWNGSAWSALGTGLNGTVQALAFSGTDLYVGGTFTMAGGVTANYIARWNGTTWSSLGSGVNNDVHALAVSGTDLYVGGVFSSAGGMTAFGVAKWNGSAWSPVGTGMDGPVHALAASGADLYAGGDFSSAGGASAYNIAKWDGSAWSALDFGVGGTVWALATSDTNVYVGGHYGVDKWDGSEWSPLGSGVNNDVLALATNHHTDVYAGGRFTLAGSKVSSYAARAVPPYPAVVQSIVDVGNDQGGRVRVRFLRSLLDRATETIVPIAGYQIYHRVDPAAAAARARPIGGRNYVAGSEAVAGVLPPGTWEAVGWVAATQSDSYTALVPTTADSTASGIQWSVYVVSAHTTTPAYWYATGPDSGYSVDNLAPSVPTGFVVNYQSGSGNQLAWNAAVDADFRFFKIYRSTTPGFTPGPSNHVHSTTTTSWTDAGFTGGTVYYKLVAVDFADNESAPASASITVGVGGTTLPVRFALHEIAPNPVRQNTLIAYDVPRPGMVRLQLYDLGGRLVRTLVDGLQAPGQRSVAWDGRDGRGRALPGGVYLVRMQADSFAQVRKLVLTR